MWINKSPQEVKSELREGRLRAGLGAACVAFLLYVFGFPHAGFNAPISARVAAILTAGITLLAWSRRAHRRRLHSSVWVCEQCNVIKEKKVPPMCACGGTLTPLCEMKWLDFPPLQEVTVSAPNKQGPLRAAHTV